MPLSLKNLSTSVLDMNKQHSAVTTGVGSSNSPQLNALPRNRTIPPPVMEGYQNQPSAYIQLNGAGYDRASKAPSRAAPQAPVVSKPPLMTQAPFRSSTIHDERYSPDNHVTRSVKLNNM